MHGQLTVTLLPFLTHYAYLCFNQLPVVIYVLLLCILVIADVEVYVICSSHECVAE